MSQLGWFFPVYGKMKNVPVTTNQIMWVWQCHWHHPFLRVNTPPIRMVFRGMVYYCYTNIMFYPPVIKHGVLENTLFSSVMFLLKPQWIRVDFQFCHVWWHRRRSAGGLGDQLAVPCGFTARLFWAAGRSSPSLFEKRQVSGQLGIRPFPSGHMER